MTQTLACSKLIQQIDAERALRVKAEKAASAFEEVGHDVAAATADRDATPPQFTPGPPGRPTQRTVLGSTAGERQSRHSYFKRRGKVIIDLRTMLRGSL